MALPWHIPLQAALNNKSKNVPPKQPSMFKHYCNIDVHQTPNEELQTSIMCDIGVVNRESATIERLIAAGMTVARLDIQDLEPVARDQLLQSIREAVYHYSTDLEYVYPLAIVMDVYGPEIETGDIKGSPKTTIDLCPSRTIRLSTDICWRECGTADCLYINYNNIEEVQPRDIVYIDSLAPGKIKLIVLEVGDDSLECSIAAGGTIGSKMAVQIIHPPKEVRPGRVDNFDPASCNEIRDNAIDNMEEQISWAIASDIDALLVVAAETAQDILKVKNILAKKGKYILVFACIDTALGFDNFDKIIVEADGIYIDRCILSNDLPVEKIFIANKIILSKCNEIGKPCICKAVLNEQIPTICVTDIANLVLDGADVIAFEFNYDSPLQKYSPSYDSVKMAEHCIAAAAVVSRQAERIIWKPFVFGDNNLMPSDSEEPTKAIAITVAELAMRSNAVVIICLTHSGRTAKLIAHMVPQCPVVAITKACHISRQLRFWRGVRAMHYFEDSHDNWVAEVESRIRAGLDYCKAKRMLRAGEPYILVSTAARRGIRYCDNVRLLFASARSTMVVEY